MIGVENIRVCGLPKCLDFVLGRPDEVLAHLDADNIQVRVEHLEQGFVKLTHLEPGFLGLGSLHLKEPKLCLGEDEEVNLGVVPTGGILEVYPAVVDQGLRGNQPTQARATERSKVFPLAKEPLSREESLAKGLSDQEQSSSPLTRWISLGL